MAPQHAPLNVLAPLPADERQAVRTLLTSVVLATDLAKHMEYLETLRQLAATKGAAALAASSAAGGAPAAAVAAGGGAVGAPGAAPAWRSPLLDADMKLLLSVAVKWADIGHSCKPRAQHVEWTRRVTDEFWRLGDREKALGVGVSPLCDRDKDVNVPKGQIGFFKFICVPFYAIVADLVEPEMLPYRRLNDNLKAWQEQVQ
jgi:hypothetical protein